MTPLPSLWSKDNDAVVSCVRALLVWLRDNVEQKAGSTEVAAVSSETTGMARVWLGDSDPDGWVEMDGTMAFQSEYPDLFAFLGSEPAGPAPYDNMFYLPPAPSVLTVGRWIIKT